MFIHPDYQKFFGFKVQGVCYEMIAMPFGWSGSPAWFMRLDGRWAHGWVPPPLHVGGKQLTCAPIRHRIFLDDFFLLFDSLPTSPRGALCQGFACLFGFEGE